MSDAAPLDQLYVLYREVDALFANTSCPASTECCRFGVTGREPYVTALELHAIERALARRGGPLSAKRRALPLHEHGDAQRERTCPLLDRGNRCAVYADRPLGCRTFFCERATRGDRDPRRALREVVARLRQLEEQAQPFGSEARPLTRALQERGLVAAERGATRR